MRYVVHHMFEMVSKFFLALKKIKKVAKVALLCTTKILATKVAIIGAKALFLVNPVVVGITYTVVAIVGGIVFVYKTGVKETMSIVTKAITTNIVIAVGNALTGIHPVIASITFTSVWIAGYLAIQNENDIGLIIGSTFAGAITGTSVVTAVFESCIGHLIVSSDVLLFFIF